jgi:hypothetical protein
MPVTRPDMPYAYTAFSNEINNINFTWHAERQNTYNTKSNTAYIYIYQFLYRDVIEYIIIFSFRGATAQIAPRSLRFFKFIDRKQLDTHTHTHTAGLL